MTRFRAVRWVVVLGFALVVLATPAQAVLLNRAFVAEQFLDTPLGGTTSAARPELAATVLEDVTEPFSIAALNITGTVQNRVVREDVSGTLDFYWRVNVDPTSTGGSVSAFRLGDFGYEYLTDADWRSDGVGSAAPFVGRLFNPTGRPDGAINYLFTDPPVQPGDPTNPATGSRFFFLHTNATQYARTASYDLIGGPNQTLSALYSTFRPVVPEPASVWLFACGLPVLGAGWRRSRVGGCY